MMHVMPVLLLVALLHAAAGCDVHDVGMVTMIMTMMSASG